MSAAFAGGLPADTVNNEENATVRIGVDSDLRCFRVCDPGRIARRSSGAKSQPFVFPGPGE